ncbi:spindle assembly abnormal 6 isoform X2 [Nomia melanderi]|nr:spindle assembly abnormal protein 6 homolog isoform X2 [Nomia melanderi]
MPSVNLSKSPPKFLLLLAEENGEWILKLVETNNFKHLCHLSLNISPASDTDLKTHMAMKIKQLKENILQQSRNTVTLEARLTDLTNKVETKTKLLEQLEQKYMAEKSQMQLSSSEQISLEKDRFAKARLDWQCQNEKEKVEVERRHTEIVKELHTEIAELRTQNLTYKDKLSLLEATNMEQTKQLQNLEKDLNVAQRDLNLLKKQNSKLDTDYHEKDKSVNSLRTKVAVLEQELKDKGILISKHTEMLKTAKEQKQQFEDLLADKEGQLQRKQNSLRNLSDELVKANEILTKLQNELASTKSKLKLRTSIALEQERLLDTKQKEVGQLENKMETLVKETKDARTEVENLKEQLKIQQNQLEEKEKIIKNNDNVISWLNRRLADSQSPLQNATVTAPITVPSSVQLTLPRTNKLITSKFETRTPALSTIQSNMLSGLPMRNPIVQNPNINQTTRMTARSMGVGITDSTMGISSFNKSGQISSTSTPMERINSLNKLSGNIAGSSSMPAVIENNNSSVPSNGTKAKSSSAGLQGGLRKAGLSDKPILPSAYFPKTLH